MGHMTSLEANCETESEFYLHCRITTMEPEYMLLVLLCVMSTTAATYYLCAKFITILMLLSNHQEFDI